MLDGDHSGHFVPRVAYSTGLLLGRVLVEIIVNFLDAYPGKGNSMSRAAIGVPPPPSRRPETEEEYAERIRTAIRRGIKAAEEGRVRTHEEALRRLAPWLGN
jgi:hypothetical protein